MMNKPDARTRAIAAAKLVGEFGPDMNDALGQEAYSALVKHIRTKYNIGTMGDLIQAYSGWVITVERPGGTIVEKTNGSGLG
jgi:hypothetical protein